VTLLNFVRKRFISLARRTHRALVVTTERSTLRAAADLAREISDTAEMPMNWAFSYHPNATLFANCVIDARLLEGVSRVRRLTRGVNRSAKIIMHRLPSRAR
jgi:hypothetical protein